VGGTYVETLQAVLANQSTCGELASVGGTDAISVGQPDGGSLLTIESSFGNGAVIEATLNDDSTISVSTASASESGDGLPGTLSLGGSFNLAGGVRFEGNYDFTSNDRTCTGSDAITRHEHLSVKTVWTNRQ
jgi:hypothetical protein